MILIHLRDPQTKLGGGQLKAGAERGNDKNYDKNW
jgi:hypothetical protein